jgi:hypothetical protein
MPKATLMPNVDIAVVFMLNARMDIPSPFATIALCPDYQTLSGIPLGGSGH